MLGKIRHYTQQVMDHFMNPRNMGEIEDPSGVGTVGDAKCGDIMRLYVTIEEGVIIDVGFKTFGCSAAVASSSVTTELIKGKTIEQALRITNKVVIEALNGLPDNKIHCSVLAEESIQAALIDYAWKHNLDIPGLAKPEEGTAESL